MTTPPTFTTLGSGQFAVLTSNALRLPLRDESVDLIVTSPPYFGMRSYHDGGTHYDGQLGDEATPQEFVENLLVATREMIRVLKPEGSLWVNLGDKYSRGSRPRNMPDQFRAKDAGVTYNDPKYVKDTRPENSGITGKSLMGVPQRYAIGCIDELGLLLRAEVIWSKPNGMPERVTDRVRRSHEQWFHFTKSQYYFCDIDAVREAKKSDDGKGKIPSSVWQVPTEPFRVPSDLGVDHYAAFPTEFPRRIVLGWSPTGGFVLDPFGGSGTTAHVAAALGRTGISIDMSEDYCRIARDLRVAEKRRARVGAILRSR